MHRVNDGLVEMANASGDGSEEGKPYLLALISASAILFAGSLAGIGVMFYYFDGCSANELVISLTLILAVVSVVRDCKRRFLECGEHWNGTKGDDEME